MVYKKLRRIWGAALAHAHTWAKLRNQAVEPAEAPTAPASPQHTGTTQVLLREATTCLSNTGRTRGQTHSH